MNEQAFILLRDKLQSIDDRLDSIEHKMDARLDALEAAAKGSWKLMTTIATICGAIGAGVARALG
jgi:hypothetical protein